MSVNANETRYVETREITIVGAVMNIVLSLLQIVGGILLASQALLADGLHTLSDLVSDGIVLFTNQKTQQAADHKHPYGYARFETAATAILGVLLGMVGIGIIWNAVDNYLTDVALPVPGLWALAIATLSIIGKETLYHMTMRVARRINSKLLESNAWHHRSDALSSIVVLVGLIGATLFGFTWMDLVAAIVVGVMIIHMAWEMISASLMDLLDRGVDAAQADAMNELIRKQPGVLAVHLLRTRHMGSFVFADVHIQVSRYLSVSEGYYIADQVRNALHKEYPELCDVVVHVDPGNDKNTAPVNALPHRAALLAKVRKLCGKHPGLAYVERINLHYLEGAVDMDICLKHGCPPVHAKTLATLCSTIPVIRQVRWFMGAGLVDGPRKQVTAPAVMARAVAERLGQLDAQFHSMEVERKKLQTLLSKRAVK